MPRPVDLSPDRTKELEEFIASYSCKGVVDPLRLAREFDQLGTISVEDRRFLSRRLAKELAADFLRKSRTKKRWSQREMATAIGLFGPNVAQFENVRSRTKVPLDLLVHVSLATGVPLNIGEQTTTVQGLKLKVERLEKELELAKALLAEQTALADSLFQKVLKPDT